MSKDHLTIAFVVVMVIVAAATLPDAMKRKHAPIVPGSPDSAAVKEMREKLRKLLDERFQGNVFALYRHYDADHDEMISRAELNNLFSDAGIGNLFTRWVWVNEVFKVIDTNNDGSISPQELLAALK